MKKIVFALAISLFALNTHAAPPSWQIIPKDSNLKFTATQNGAPVSGEFKRFTGDIKFDPAHLDGNSVTINVDMSSIANPYADLVDTLKSADWFHIKNFPQAVFSATKFTKKGDKDFQAIGTLTIRNKTVPVVLNFTQDEYTTTKAKIHGSTILKRNDFGVGQGEWSSTAEIKDEVKVEFVVSATTK